MSTPLPNPSNEPSNTPTNVTSLVDRRLLHETVIDQLRDLIVQGELAPETKLNERVLAERLGTSRTPLREAIKFLARVRLGVALGRIDGIPLALVNRLLLEVQPAHLARATGGSVGNGRDDRAQRAELVRGSLR
jgi:hypothetical protein